MKLSRKYILYFLILAVIISALPVVGAVVAKYLTDITGTGNISLTPAALINDINGPADKGKGSYVISHPAENSMPGFIRCAVVVNWVDGDNHIWAIPPTEGTDYTISFTDFTRLDGYFYYNLPVDPSSSVTVSVDQLKEKTGFKLSVRILAESIQSVPESAVKDAWGVVYDAVNDTWTK